MAHAPIERILVETDSPVNYKDGEDSFMAEPKDVIRTWKALAQLKDLNEQEVLATVNTNAKEFFQDINMKNKIVWVIGILLAFGIGILGMVPAPGIAGGAGIAVPSAGFCPFGPCAKSISIR